MEIHVSTEIIGRLSRVSEYVPKGEKREWLKSFFVERRNGHAFAGVTNSVFAAVQYLGISEGSDGFVLIDSRLLPLKAWAEDDASCRIVNVPELGWSSVGVPGGREFASLAIRDVEALETVSNWRKWFPTEEPATGRPMFSEIDGLTALARSSPSGKIIFPQKIDSDQPIIVRDIASPDWVGVFMARPANGLFPQGAVRPDWIF